MKQEANRSEKKAWNPIVVLALFLCAIFGIAALTYSWLTQSTTAVPTSEGEYSLETAYIDDFSYSLDYRFGSSGSWNSADSADIIVDYSANTGAENHISKLQFRIKQTGTVKSAVRVRFDYQWFKTDSTTGANGTTRRTVQGPKLTLVPTFADSGVWHYNASDGCYYCYDGSAYVFPRNQDMIVTGFSLASIPVSNASLKIIPTVEGVQFNRYREVWEVSSMPGSNS